MSDYGNARKFSEKVVNESPFLLDFNTLTPANAPNLPPFLNNPEILYFNSAMGTNLTGAAFIIADSNLYASYADNDLRKSVFFVKSIAGPIGTVRFKGSYYNNVNASVFYGLTTDEMYLILAESLVRSNLVNEGLAVLNFLIRKRYIIGSFQDYDTQDKDEALGIVLNERRKELVFRGQRWMDIRRLNLEGRNIEIRRLIDGNTYILPPNDLRSTY